MATHFRSLDLTMLNNEAQIEGSPRDQAKKSGSLASNSHLPAALDVLTLPAGVTLVLSTCVNAINAVLDRLEHSSPQMGKDVARTKQVISLSKIVTENSSERRWEACDDDNLISSSLMDDICKVSDRTKQWSQSCGRSMFAGEPNAQREAGTLELIRQSHPSRSKIYKSTISTKSTSPDSVTIRKIIKNRSYRAHYFGDNVFADPAWDMLLDLFAAHLENRRVSVSSLCIASATPSTTALRWISIMTSAGLLQRCNDESDRRRAFISLTNKALAGMHDYFAYCNNNKII